MSLIWCTSTVMGDFRLKCLVMACEMNSWCNFRHLRVKGEKAITLILFTTYPVKKSSMELETLSLKFKFETWIKKGNALTEAQTRSRAHTYTYTYTGPCLSFYKWVSSKQFHIVLKTNICPSKIEEKDEKSQLLEDCQVSIFDSISNKCQVEFPDTPTYIPLQI